MALTAPQKKNCEECIGCVRVSGPIVIEEPGCYYVTNSISAASGDVIVIRANDVSLDLKGHTVGLAAASFDSSAFFASARADSTSAFAVASSEAALSPSVFSVW